MLKFGLELLARKREVSLSQACEFAIASTLRSEKFDDKPIFDIAREALTVVNERGEALALNTDIRILALLRLPEKLRSPEESFVLGVYTSMRSKIPLDRMSDFYALAARAFGLGLSQRDAIKELIEEFTQSAGTLKSTHGKPALP